MKKIVISCLLLILLISNGNSFEIKISKLIDLENPWGSTFINNDELLVTEKYGSIKLINLKNKKVSSINHNINFLVDGQGGLLDILYKDEFVYVSYSEDRGSGKSSTSITKGKFNYQNINFKNIFRAEPPIKSGYHFGSRLAIKENTIFASSGERGGGMVAQDPSNHIGTIIRVNLDGSIPKDNPKFIDKPDWLPEIYQIGVRNPQGLAYSSFDGKIYASNHGCLHKFFHQMKNKLNLGGYERQFDIFLATNQVYQ